MTTEAIESAIKGGLEDHLGVEEAAKQMKTWREDGTLDKLVQECRQALGRTNQDDPEAVMSVLSDYARDVVPMKL